MTKQQLQETKQEMVQALQEKEIKMLTKENQRKEEKMNNLEENKEIQEQEIKKLREENQHNKEKINTLEHSLKEKEQNIQQLNNSIDELHQKVAKQKLPLPICPYTWEIDSEEFLKAKDENRQLFSPKFFCFGNYTAYIRCYPNGGREAKNTHMSIYFQIVKGPFDCVLAWPMMYREITLKLMINGQRVHQYLFRSNESEKAKNRFISPEIDGGRGFVTHHAHEKLQKFSKYSTMAIVVDVE